MQGGTELRGLANYGTSARSVAAGSLVDTASHRAHLSPWEWWLGSAATELSLGDGKASSVQPKDPRAGKPGSLRMQ